MAPPTVELVGQRFGLVFVPSSDSRLEGSKDITNVGAARIADQELVIATDIGSDQQRDTVIHEVLHGLFGIAGFRGAGVDREAMNFEEERIVGTLAPLLLLTIRRNPALIDYLTEGASGG